MKNVLAIRRADQFSPNSVEKDRAILMAVVEKLEQPVRVMDEDEYVLQPISADLIISMARRKETLLLLAQQAGDASLEEDQNVKTEAKIKEMLKTACNNDIVVEPAAAPILTDEQQKAAIKEAIKQSKKLAENGNKSKVDNSKPVEAVQRTATDYVIENVIHTTLKIVENKDKK